MASSYTVLGTEKMTTGENAGTWGTTTNTNLEILEQAFGGYLSKSIAGGVQTTTLAITDGDSTASTSEARHHVIKLTGTITGNQTVTVPADIVKSYIVSNATSGAYTVLFKAASASGFTFAATNKGTQLLFADGTNIVDTGIGSVATYDLDGGELTLDADSDTSITASTDDQIDFEIAGADDFTMTANAFNVLTGSHATFADSANAKFGTGNDMLVYHDGSNSYITNATGALKLATETSGIALTIGHTTSETTIADNLTTTGNTSVGGTLGVTGVATFATHVALGDSDILKLGAGTDLTLYHDGSNSYITNAVGALKVATETSGIAVTIGHTTSETTIADNLTVTGTLTGTLATAAQGSVTSLGTLTTLTVDNIITNGATIGHTSDTDLLTLADGALTVAGTIGSGAITSTGIVTGTAFTAGSAVLAEAELELLDGLTAGTAIASKVVTTDSSIDTTGQRNLTISGELDAATGDFSGDVDVDGTLEADAITINSTAIGSIYGVVAGSSSILTTGALDTGSITSGFGAIDNGTSNIRSATITAETAFVPDASGGADLGTTALEFNDLFLNDSGSIQFGDDQDTTLTHTDGTGLTLNSTNKLCFNDASQFIQGASATVLDIAATDEVELTATLIDVVGNLAVSGTLAQAGVATFSVAANVAQVALTSSSNAVAWDASAAANAYHLTTENTTISAPSNAVEGAFICLELNHDGTTTVGWNAIFNFAADTAPTTTDTNAKTDILVFRYNGAIWQEVGRTLNIPES